MPRRGHRAPAIDGAADRGAAFELAQLRGDLIGGLVDPDGSLLRLVQNP